MSKIGRTPVAIPAGVTATLNGAVLAVKGAKGELQVQVPEGITVAVAEGEITVARSSDARQDRANHGLIRSLINNAVTGASAGYSKTLKLIGTGYRAQNQGAGLRLALGFSHPVDFPGVAGITFKVENQDTIVITGIDKQVVGQVAANIRKIRPPEPYQGKGVRYEDEVVRRKQGKATTK